MLEQIETSTEYRRSPRRLDYKPKKMDGTSWLKSRVTWAKKDLEMAEERLAEAIETNRSRNQWLADLRASVPQP